MKKTATLLGFFDGLHPGHMSLINKALELETAGIEACAYIFDKHPMQVYNRDVKLIMNNEQKIRAIKAAGINRIEVQQICKEFLQKSPQSFVKEVICEKLNAAYVIVGENYTFGKNKSGDVKFLETECRRYGIEVICMPYVTVGGEIISSTYIRTLIENGEIKKANKLMAESYEICGEVITGRQEGRKMGFPTANILPPPNKIMPKNGVYATVTNIGEKSYPSVTNVGFAPTFGVNRKVVETNIPGFNEDIYSKTITVEFLDAIRFEKKFDSVDELIIQIDKDVRRRMENGKCDS